MQISRWGNSLAVRLPASVVEALDLKEGDDIEILIAGDRSFAIDRKRSVAERLELMRRFRHRLPTDFRFHRDSANER
jgi:antitoxin MazE